jgi:hypothetical protein
MSKSKTASKKKKSDKKKSDKKKSTVPDAPVVEPTNTPEFLQAMQEGECTEDEFAKMTPEEQIQLKANFDEEVDEPVAADVPDLPETPSYAKSDEKAVPPEDAPVATKQDKPAASDATSGSDLLDALGGSPAVPTSVDPSTGAVEPLTGVAKDNMTEVLQLISDMNEVCVTDVKRATKLDREAITWLRQAEDQELLTSHWHESKRRWSLTPAGTAMLNRLRD